MLLGSTLDSDMPASPGQCAIDRLCMESGLTGLYILQSTVRLLRSLTAYYPCTIFTFWEIDISLHPIPTQTTNVR